MLILDIISMLKNKNSHAKNEVWNKEKISFKKIPSLSNTNVKFA